jgi:pectinesterase
VKLFRLALSSLLLGSTCLAEVKIITVSPDGSGDFKTVQEAVDAAPDYPSERTILHIKPGSYEGQTFIPKSKSKISFEGDGTQATVLTYKYNTNEPNPTGVERQYWGTNVVVLSDDFQAHNLTFENASGDHGQALALRIDGDRAVVSDCHLLGWQDTLMLNNGRQYFHNDYIAGRVDFIYGSGTTIFDHCEIHSKNGGHVTAASTPPEHPYGFVFLDCKLTGDSIPWDPATTNPTTTQKPRITPIADLGRPWRPYASVTYLNCEMGDHIRPQGWNNWGKASNETTARYSEYKSTGPGGSPDQRFAWSHQLTDDQAKQITLQAVLGGDDHWDPAAIAQSPKSSPTTQGAN